MRTVAFRFLPLVSLFIFSQPIMAQAPDGNSDNNTLLLSLLAILMLLVFFVLIQVADNLLQIEGKKIGADGKVTGSSIFPSVKDLFRKKVPAYARNTQVIHLDRGFDIRIEGGAKTKKDGKKNLDDKLKVQTFAIQPANFRGIKPIPKVLVETGQKVKAGDPLFYDKGDERIKYVAPVSGEVIAINRGERRAIAEVVIRAGEQMQYRPLGKFDLEKESREALVNFLMANGGWTLLRQRPYDLIADPACTPVNIFVSTFDTAPLAPDNNFVVEGREEAFQRGLDALNKLTDGSVFLGLSTREKEAPSPAFTSAQGVEKRWFSGAHPAGNVGVQIHHIAPIGANTEVWTLGVQEVITLGALFTEGRYNAQRVVAITGAELEQPRYMRTYIGANIGDLVSKNLKKGPIRLISGDVLSGQKKTPDSFLNFYDDQVTAVSEGEYYEMFGWLWPGKLTPTLSRSFPNFLFPKATYRADTNTHGERRAFVVTGQYESVLPMDILPQHLMKAILTNDYDGMEGLGICELIEEDVALCEFVCTSKQPLQKILRQGLDMMQEQS